MLLEGRPSSGVRLEVERNLDDEVGDGVIVYVGHAHLAEESVPLRLRASARGVEVQLEGAGARSAEDAARHQPLITVVAALVRAATKKDLIAGIQPSRRIVRWRALNEPSEPG